MQKALAFNIQKNTVSSSLRDVLRAGSWEEDVFNADFNLFHTTEVTPSGMTGGCDWKMSRRFRALPSQTCAIWDWLSMNSQKDNF